MHPRVAVLPDVRILPPGAAGVLPGGWPVPGKAAALLGFKLEHIDGRRPGRVVVAVAVDADVVGLGVVSRERVGVRRQVHPQEGIL